MTTPDPLLRAQRASSFGSQAARYAEHRPDYPPAAVDWILPPDAGHVLDLAAGTGKLTEALVVRGLRVTAVEPDPAMLGELRKRSPQATGMPGTAEEIPLDDGSVDAVVVGQAFHWFDVPRALTEIGRVLRPGGVLAALWNHEDNRVPWVSGFETLVRTNISRAWVDPGPLPDDHPAFEPFERRMFDHSFRRTAEGLAATLGTHSHMLVADDTERNAATERLMTYLRGRPETAAGEFDLPLRTLVLKTRRYR
ncbi:MAG: class I SAM-dependent methyltransferase [Kibdelosporangium sp.]